MNRGPVLNRAPRDTGRSAADTAPAGSQGSPEPTIHPVVAKPHITDHAVLRYLERGYGLDVEAVKAEMMIGILPAVDFGAPVVIVHGVRLVLVNGTRCVTALPGRKYRRDR